jgi:hypothetical protein
MQPIQRLKTMVITLPMRKVNIETDGALALSTIPARIAKKQSLNSNTPGRKEPQLHRD